MYKTLLRSFLLCVTLASCSEGLTPAPTETASSMPTPVQPISAPELVREIKLDTQSGTSYTLDWSHDGEILAAGSGAEITLLSADLSEPVAVLKPAGGALGIAWSPDGDQIATVNGYRNPTITIWNLDNSNQLILDRQIDGGTDQYGVSWSPDGNLLATLGDDEKSTIQLWDTRTWKEIHRYELPYANPRRALNWNADSTTLYDAGDSDGQVVAFALNVSDGKVQELGKFPVDDVYAFVVSPDAKTTAIADERGIVQFVEIATGEFITSIKTVDQPVDLAWNPNGQTLAILGYQTALQLWEFKK